MPDVASVGVDGTASRTWQRSAAHRVSRALGGISLVGGLLLVGTAVAHSSSPTYTSEAYVGLLGAVLAVAGLALVLRPYPIHPFRLVFGALLLPIAVSWFVTGVADIGRSIDYGQRTDEPRFHADDTYEGFVTSASNPRYVSEEAVRAVTRRAKQNTLMGSALLLVSTVSIRLATNRQKKPQEAAQQRTGLRAVAEANGIPCQCGGGPEHCFRGDPFDAGPQSEVPTNRPRSPNMAP